MRCFQELEVLGWTLALFTTRAAIAQEACGGNVEGRCDFETGVGQGRDRFAVFFTAVKD